jgi:hypothetical protein
MIFFMSFFTLNLSELLKFKSFAVAAKLLIELLLFFNKGDFLGEFNGELKLL